MGSNQRSTSTSRQGAGIMAEADGMMVPPPPQGLELGGRSKEEDTFEYIYIGVSFQK